MHTVWDDDDGLPHSTVNAVVQTPDGYLWVGTDGGVVRFNGAAFDVYDRSNTEAFADGHTVRTLLVDESGRLWIGTTGAGLVQYADGRFTEVATPAALDRAQVSALHADPSGTLWMGTAEGLYRLDKDGAPRVVGPDDGLPGPFVVALGHGTDGRGLMRVRDGTAETLTSAHGLLNNRVVALFQDREGSLWFGTEGGGLDQLRDGAFTPFGTPEGVSSDMILSVYEDAEGELVARHRGWRREPGARRPGHGAYHRRRAV